MKAETLAVHGGYTPDPVTKSAAVPLYQTVAYAFDSAQHGADLFDLKVAGNIYSRIMNPTNDVLEKRVAALEGGIAALAWPRAWRPSRQPSRPLPRRATTSCPAARCTAAPTTCLRTRFRSRASRCALPTRATPPALPALMDDRTKAVFCESIGNPLGNVTDIAALAAVAHAHGVPLIVDNTVPSPYLCRPIEHGADIVVHALTKYMNGHGNSIGGIIVDSGKFPWAEHKARFKRLNEPDVSYHGVVYTEALGAAAFIGRARVVPLRNMGAALSPFNAWLTLMGIETLPLRMDRICDNTLALAKRLQAHPKVEWVRYAGLPDHADHAVAQRQMGGRASGILSFGLKTTDADPRAAGARFLDALQLFTRLVNIGDAKSLATHPASTTHRQLNPAELAKAGVSENMVRLSVGIEHIDDLMADLDQALAAV
jgi:O-acetylhomoserine (thiol)-lyase